MKKTMIAISGILFYAVVLVSVNYYHKMHPITPVNSMNDEISTQLLHYMEEHRMDPVEPRLDSVFHFIPGLKGMEIDYGLSYQNMIAKGVFDESLIVCQSIDYKGDPEEFRAEPMYKGNEQGQYVSLLINVAWGEEELDKMVKILDRLGVKATFFFEGRYAENHKNQVQKIHDRGHVVGNHSYSHPSRWGTFSYEQYKEEVVKTNEVLSAIIQEPIVYFAPPGGEFNDKTLKAAYDQNMYNILWTVDTIDWRGGDASTMINRVMSNIEPGALVLMHPKPQTVIALEPMIQQLKAEGYQFKTIDQMVHGERPECIIKP